MKSYLYLPSGHIGIAGDCKAEELARKSAAVTLSVECKQTEAPPYLAFHFLRSHKILPAREKP